KVKVDERGRQAELAHHGHHRLDDTRASPLTFGYADERDRFVDVFFEQQIEDGFERARVAVVVFGRDDDEPIRSRDGVAPFRKPVFDVFAVIVVRQVEARGVEQRGFNVGPLLQLPEKPSRGKLAAPAFAVRAQENREKQLIHDTPPCSSRTPGVDAWVSIFSTDSTFAMFRPDVAPGPSDSTPPYATPAPLPACRFPSRSLRPSCRGCR